MAAFKDAFKPVRAGHVGNRLNGFQDRCLKPLGHASEVAILPEVGLLLLLCAARGACDIARERLYLFSGKLCVGRHRADAGLHRLRDTLCIRLQFVERRADVRVRASVG